MEKTLRPCGTEAAYKRHRKLGETPCDPCRRAHGEDGAERKRRRGHLWNLPAPHPRQLAPCGTVAAHARHRRRGEPPCDPCREAHGAYRRERYVAHPIPLKPCGTDAAKARHYKAGESCAVCDYVPGRRPGRPPSRPCGTEAARVRHARRSETCDTCGYWPGKPGGRPRFIGDVCGTAAGRKRHQRAGEPVCERCRTWFNDSRRDAA